jgi:hypothetical protein
MSQAGAHTTTVQRNPRSVQKHWSSSGGVFSVRAAAQNLFWVEHSSSHVVGSNLPPESTID